MHGDFKYNFIRYHLLNEALDNKIEANKFTDFFKQKDVQNVSEVEINNQLEHLRSEDFLIKTSDVEYEITQDGKTEIKEVLDAMKHFS